MAEITDKVILGLDFLEANKAIVDHGQYSIHINGEMIQATFALNEQEEHLQKKKKMSQYVWATIMPFQALHSEIDSWITPFSKICFK